MCFSITEPLHFLHMDLFGPVPTRSRSGKKYTLFIVDEFSRFTWVLFLRKKSNVADEIIYFITQSEVLYNFKVRKLRSNHETEFRNLTLDDFYDSKGIAQNFSVVRAPQENGVAERRNRTLIEAGRTMVIDAGLPLLF